MYLLPAYTKLLLLFSIGGGSTRILGGRAIAVTVTVDGGQGGWNTGSVFTSQAQDSVGLYCVRIDIVVFFI